MQNIFTGKLTQTRGGAIGLGIAAAVVAGLLLLVYLNRYRDSVAGETAPTSVIVAKSLILKGTSGTIIGTKKLFETTTIPQKEVKVGAITDPAYLNGRVAAVDILPGQQLAAADFSTVTTEAVVTKITGSQRAISVPIDSVHGSLSQLAAGDRVDVYIALTAQRGGAGGQSIVKLFRPNVLVLAVPSSGGGGALSGGGGSGNVMLRIDAKDAADVAYASDNGTLWFALRPQAGAKKTPADTATLNTVLR